MKDLLKQRCDLFVKNRDIMKNNFKWDNSMLHPLCASLYVEKGLVVDANRIKLSKDIIKKNTSVFSQFKSTAFLPLATMLSLDKNPESKFPEVLITYELLKKEFHSSPYLPLSAFVLANMVESYDYDRVVAKSKDIFQRMKKEHPFLTTGEDCGFAVMIAISNLTADAAIDEMEKCYDLLYKQSFPTNSIQSLSHTLVLGEENAHNKCNKVIEIFNQLKEKDCKYGKGVELAVLGVLALTTDNTDETANDICDVNEYLLSCKGFGPLGIGKAQRIMYCAILVAHEYEKQCSQRIMGMSTVNSITSIIIAQQVAVSAAITASAAASAASN